MTQKQIMDNSGNVQFHTRFDEVLNFSNAKLELELLFSAHISIWKRKFITSAAFFSKICYVPISYQI